LAVRTEANMSASEGSPRSPRQPEAANTVSAGLFTSDSEAKLDDRASITARWPNLPFIATHLQLHLAITKRI
jgi:hypothetical protein